MKDKSCYSYKTTEICDKTSSFQYTYNKLLKLAAAILRKFQAQTLTTLAYRMSS